MPGLTAKGVAEAVGVLAVVGSLVFVGLEVRQNSVAVRASNNATVADAFRELNLVIASNPALVNAAISVAQDVEAASDTEKALVTALWRSIFHTWSNAHRQWVNDTLDEALFASVVEEIATYSLHANLDNSISGFERRRRQMLWAWESEKFVFNSEFRNFVDQIIETGEPPSR